MFKSLEPLFKRKKQYFNLFVQYSFKAEDWIKTEIVKLWHQEHDVSFTGISHAIDDLHGKPDLSLITNKRKRETIELKVLPIDRNYRTAAQRFNANRHNKKDFENLRKGERDFIIYVFWNQRNE